MKIKYGIINNTIDVTDICLDKLNNNNIINIPSGDCKRATYFTDPVRGKLKKIFILIDGNLTEYDHLCSIRIDLKNNIIQKATGKLAGKWTGRQAGSQVRKRSRCRACSGPSVQEAAVTQQLFTQESTVGQNIDNKLQNIHSTLKIKYGKFQDELPEQKMSVRYLTGHEKVLEIGGHIGRNSLVIASILQNNNQLVTLEIQEKKVNKLKENKKLNNLSFHIENAALSNRKLIHKNTTSIPSETLKPGYDWVNTITFKELELKYNIQFDTLVLDCEGAFFYILIDMPEILNKINLIIMENDYNNISHYRYIKKLLTENNFKSDYVEAGGWGPCKKFFYEVFKK